MNVSSGFLDRITSNIQAYYYCFCIDAQVYKNTFVIIFKDHARDFDKSCFILGKRNSQQKVIKLLQQ